MGPETCARMLEVGFIARGVIELGERTSGLFSASLEAASLIGAPLVKRDFLPGTPSSSETRQGIGRSRLRAPPSTKPVDFFCSANRSMNLVRYSSSSCGRLHRVRPASQIRDRDRNNQMHAMHAQQRSYLWTTGLRQASGTSDPFDSSKYLTRAAVPLWPSAVTTRNMSRVHVRGPPVRFIVAITTELQRKDWDHPATVVPLSVFAPHLYIHDASEKVNAASMRWHGKHVRTESQGIRVIFPVTSCNAIGQALREQNMVWGEICILASAEGAYDCGGRSKGP